MTSKISFFSLVKQERKKQSWLMALQFVVFGLMLPFRVLLVLSSARRYGEDLSYVFCQNAGLGRWENTFVILCAGIVCSLVVYSYLHSSSQLDFYHSLAIERKILFAVKAASVLETFVLSYVTCQSLVVLAGIVSGVFSSQLLTEMLIATMQGILHFICSFLAATVAIMLTGKLLTTILAIGVMGLYGPMIFVIYIGLMQNFMTTWFGSGYMDVLSKKVLMFTSPWSYCLFQTAVIHERFSNSGTMGMTGYWPTAAGMIGLFILILALLLICLMLYSVRRTEAAGDALAFRWTESVIKLLLTIPVAVAAAMIAYEIMFSIVWAWVFIVLFGGLACIVMEFIYRWDIRQALMHKSHILITIVAAGLIFEFFALDLIGFNSYLPEKEELASMAVREANMAYHSLDENGYVNAYDFYTLDRAMLDTFEMEEFDGLYRLAENGVKHNRDKRANCLFVGVKYHLKNGKEIYREYTVDQELYFEVMDELQNRPEFREKYYPILTWDDAYISSIHNASIDLSGELAAKLELTHEAFRKVGTKPNTVWYLTNSDLKKLVEAYQKDLSEVSFKDVWEYSGNVLRVELPTAVNWKMYVNDEYSFNEKFTNTIAVLKKILPKMEAEIIY